MLHSIMLCIMQHGLDQEPPPFVPPPADVEGPNSGGGSFDVAMLMGDSTWALPMLKGLVGLYVRGQSLRPLRSRRTPPGPGKQN